MAFPFSFFSICGTALGVSRIGGNTRVLPLGLSYRSTNIKVERVRLKYPHPVHTIRGFCRRFNQHDIITLLYCACFPWNLGSIRRLFL